MKKIHAPIFLLLVLCSFSFKSFDGEVEKCLLKEGETISFSNKPKASNERTFMSMKKGSYDGSGFDFKIDSANRITISNISPSDGPKQDEFMLAGCTGSLTRNKEVLTIMLEKCRKGYYLVDLDHSTLVANFDSIVRVMLKAETLTAKPAEYYCHEKDRSGVYMKKVTGADGELKEDYKQENDHSAHTTIHITAVPAGIKKGELFAAKHPARSLAHFAEIEIELAGGKTMKFPQGSYILFEGNSIDVK